MDSSIGSGLAYLWLCFSMLHLWMELLVMISISESDMIRISIDRERWGIWVQWICRCHFLGLSFGHSKIYDWEKRRASFQKFVQMLTKNSFQGLPFYFNLFQKTEKVLSKPDLSSGIVFSDTFRTLKHVYIVKLKIIILCSKR